MTLMMDKFTAKAKELALEWGAEGVVIVVLTSSEDDKSWEGSHGAYLAGEAPWGVMAMAVENAADYLRTGPFEEDELPS